MPDDIPQVSAKQFAQTMSNPAQDLYSKPDPSEASKGSHDIGFSVEENIFNKCRLDATIEEHKKNQRSRG